MRDVLLLTVLLWPSVAWCQATAVIDGPTEAAAGDLIILDASDSDCDSCLWMLANSDKSFLEFEDGRKCVFASGAAGSYSFVLATAKQGDTAATVAIARHVVTIGGTPPGPNPGPNPGPGPKPTPPDPQPPQPDLTGVAREAYDAALALAPKPGECARVATVFSTVASKAAGLGWDLPKIAAESKAAAFVDPDAVRRWKPFNTFFVGVMMKQRTPSDAIEALEQIAVGLNAAEQSLGKSGAVSGASGDPANDTIRGMLEKLRGDLRGIQQEVGS